MSAPLHERLERAMHKAQLAGAEAKINALELGMREMLQLAQQTGQPLPDLEVTP